MKNLDLEVAMIGAIVGLVVAIFTSHVTKINELDNKSGWRGKLFDLASKDLMRLDDVYLLRATLRFNYHTQPYDIYSFKFMSNQMTDFCNHLVDKYQMESYTDEGSIIISDAVDREKIRIYARYLLKNHWEVFASKILFFNYEFKLKKEYAIGKETHELIQMMNRKRDAGNE